MAENTLLFGFVIFLAIAFTVSAIMPDNLKILSGYDFGIMTAEFFGVAAACSIATGLLCAVGIGAATVLNIALSAIDFGFNSGDPTIRAIVILPITFMLLYFAVKTGRGGG